MVGFGFWGFKVGVLEFWGFGVWGFGVLRFWSFGALIKKLFLKFSSIQFENEKYT